MEKKVKKQSGSEEAIIEILGNPEIDQPGAVFVRSQSSVSIETDSKGTKKYSVKVYDDNPEVACNKALELSKKIEERI